MLTPGRLHEISETRQMLQCGLNHPRHGSFLSASAAFAQSPPAQPGPGNNAVNSAGQNNASAPVAGRNSFTEGQAKTAIEKAGYSNVSELKKDGAGVWRGKAAKGGTTVAISIDFQGNVIAAK